MMRLYTAGYRHPATDQRLPPEAFYSGLPEEAAVVDIRSHPYSPFAPEYTHKGVGVAVELYKPGVKAFHHLKALGNTHRDSNGKRLSPPHFLDPDAGFPLLEEYLRQYGSVVIFCACSYLTRDSSTHRCHRFYVAEEMEKRMPRLEVVHLECWPTAEKQMPTA